jgi:hypothetical protein
VKEEEENWENKAFWKLSWGTVVVGNFGLRGQETTRIHRAREMERMFLVGWEVNIQFGVVWHDHKQAENGLNQLIYRLR